MVSSVTLGNFFTTSNGKTVLGGAGGSGLDTQSLIKALVDAKSQPATNDQDKITLNDKQSAALTTFQTLLSTFQSATDILRNPPGVGNAASNVFQYTTASVVADNGNAGSNYLTATTTPGAALQSYTISNVISLASAARQTSGVFTVASADASVVPPASGSVAFGAGTIHFNGGDVTVKSGDSLNAIAAKFNAVSATTGVNATVIQIDSGDYELSFAANSTGTAGNFNLSTATGDAGVLASASLSAPVNGTIADFKINGIEVTRQTNNISDLVSGVTFNLLQKTSGANLTVNIQPDTTTVQNSIVNFVTAYNAIKSFAAQQTQLNSDGTYADTAILANNTTFLNTINSLTSEVTAKVAGLTGTTQSLADVGITLTTQPASSTLPQVNNILTVNDGQLSSTLSTNFSAVNQLFGFTLSSTNPNLKVFSETNALGVSNFTLTANPFATQTTKVLNVADADTSIVSDTPADGQFQSGNVVINGQTITLTAGDTLNIIANKFNAVHLSSGLAATVTNVGAGQYTLSFVSTPPSSGANYDLNSSGVDATGVFDNVGVTATGLYQATYDLGDGHGPVTKNLTATALTDALGNPTGYSLAGQAGTPLEGLQLIYASTNSAIAPVTTTQGVADKSYNTTFSATQANTGTLAVALKSLADSDTQLNKDITQINTQVSQYQDQLLQKFGALETAVSKVNTLLQSLTAQQDAALSAAGH